LSGGNICCKEENQLAGFCEQCGKPVLPDSNFCENCGAPIIPSIQPDQVVGHVLAKGRERPKKSGERLPTNMFTIVFTPKQLLFIKETAEMNSVSVQESERIFQEISRRDMSIRKLMESYQWDGPLWQHYYSTPAEQLLDENRENWGLDTATIQRAVIRLDKEEELDELDIHLVNGQCLKIYVYMVGGGAAYKFLSDTLGSRVQMEP
jgi:hypothetical protein